LYALILAGGFGSRLWPKSRERMPKHLLELTGPRSLLRETYLRAEPLIPPERILVITGHTHADATRGQLPELPAANILVEPCARGTAACVGLAALHIRRRDPNAVMVSMHADHIIADPAGFREALAEASDLAARGYIMTLGVTPSAPETGYGYIERGAPLHDCATGAYSIARFTEKPDLARARQFLATGRYYWNSGIFVWKVSRLLDEMERLLPDVYSELMKVEAAMGTPQESQVLADVWPQVRSVTVDVGIMEKAERAAVIPISVGWTDVGSWSSVADALPADEDGNVIVGPHIAIDTRNTLVMGKDRLVATVGLQDMIVVDNGDSILVCPKDRAQDVKKLVDILRKQGRQEYL
jgi:mannose-1-phosphate guanylyltransferase